MRRLDHDGARSRNGGVPEARVPLPLEPACCSSEERPRPRSVPGRTHCCRCCWPRRSPIWAALVSRPKFRDAIDAQIYKETQQSGTRRVLAGSESLIEIVNSLTPPSRQRFEALRVAMPGDEVHRARRGRSIGFLIGGFEHAGSGSAALDFFAAAGVTTGAGPVSPRPPMTARFARELRMRKPN